MLPCFQIPDALFDEVIIALGPKWCQQDAQYTACAIEHVKRIGACYVPLRATIPRDLIEVRPLAPDRLAAMITPLLPRLPGHTRAARQALSLPSRVVVEGDVPVIHDGHAVRAWRLCESCLRLFRTVLGRPTQRYCDNACGNLAEAWRMWAHNGARYPAMLGGVRVEWGERVAFDGATLFPTPSMFGIQGVRRLGIAWSFRHSKRKRLLQEYQGRIGYFYDGKLPRACMITRLTAWTRARWRACRQWAQTLWIGGD